MALVTLLFLLAVAVAASTCRRALGLRQIQAHGMKKGHRSMMCDFMFMIVFVSGYLFTGTAFGSL